MVLVIGPISDSAQVENRAEFQNLMKIKLKMC